jgi:hypothetical protein
MRTDLFIRHIVILTSLVLISWLSALAAEPPPAKTPPPVSTVGQANIAAGSVEDTLKGCLARIPKDGSTGQRMLAQQSCETAEGTRKLDNAAPKF